VQPSEKTDLAFLDDIVEACALIMNRAQGKTLPDFVNDRDLQDSIMLRLIVIGEASKNLSEKCRKRFPSIQWKDMMRLRDFAVHHYWSIDAFKIWKIIQKDIPELFELLED
jgi:uncharacterized protein with HEPN domain